MKTKPNPTMYKYYLVVISNRICAETMAQRILNTELEEHNKVIILN